MTKREKIAALATAMQCSTRGADKEEGEKYYHFTSSAPEELKNLYLEHYEVRDVDYETFSRACDIVDELYKDKPEISDDDATDEIYERASDSANPYTAVRLGYLNIWNQDEISETIHMYGRETDISTAVAIWYDKQVEQAAILIKDWVNAA